LHTYTVGGDDVLVHNNNGPKRLPNDELIPPSKRDNAPISKKDGKPIELHHDGQMPDSPLKEMHMTEHRGSGNYKKNHPEKGPSQIDRPKHDKNRKEHWSQVWDDSNWGGN